MDRCGRSEAIALRVEQEPVPISLDVTTLPNNLLSRLPSSILLPSFSIINDLPPRTRRVEWSLPSPRLPYPRCTAFEQLVAIRERKGLRGFRVGARGGKQEIRHFYCHVDEVPGSATVPNSNSRRCTRESDKIPLTFYPVLSLHEY